MKLVVSVLSISILMFVFAANKAHAQAAPLYDVTYTPDTGSSSYSGEVSARTKSPNLRGQSSPTIAFASSARGRTTTIVGSQASTADGNEMWSVRMPDAFQSIE